MARKIEVTLVDDIDGTDASKTIEFAYAGTTYQIDLNETHIAELESALTPYLRAARKVSASRGRGHAAASVKSGPTATAVRQWAEETGQGVSKRGRVPRALVNAYIAAH